MSSQIPSISTETINEKVLSNFQKHRQLTMRESEFLTLELLTLLCDSHVSDPKTLKYLARFLTPEAYDDLIEERNINNLCGYPLCKSPPERNKNEKSHYSSKSDVAHSYTVSHQHDAIIQRFLWENNPYAYLSKYCSKIHYRSSQLYQIQLSDEALFARTGIHLLNDTLKQDQSNGNENEYSIMLYEDLLREKTESDSHETDIKAVIKGIKRLGFQESSDSHGNGIQNSEESRILEEQLSKWLEDIKIVEDQNPSIIGDYGKVSE